MLLYLYGLIDRRPRDIDVILTRKMHREDYSRYDKHYTTKSDVFNNRLGYSKHEIYLDSRYINFDFFLVKDINYLISSIGNYVIRTHSVCDLLKIKHQICISQTSNDIFSKTEMI